jgi:hypothetical protein
LGFFIEQFFADLIIKDIAGRGRISRETARFRDHADVEPGEALAAGAMSAVLDVCLRPLSLVLRQLVS